MERRPDWQARLTAYLAEVRARPFADDWHCALFAAGGVEAMTGMDLAAPYRGRWTTPRGGLRVLRRSGFADHLALAGVHLPEILPSEAWPGDVAAVDEGALGIVQGRLVYVLGPSGVGLLPAEAIRRAFRVGA